MSSGAVSAEPMRAMFALRSGDGARSGFSEGDLFPVRPDTGHVTAAFMAAAPSVSANATGTAFPIHRAIAFFAPENS